MWDKMFEDDNLKNIKESWVHIEKDEFKEETHLKQYT